LYFHTANIVTYVSYMDFAITMHAMLNENTEGVFPKKGFLLGTYVHVLTAKCMKMVLFPVLLCSLT